MAPDKAPQPPEDRPDKGKGQPPAPDPSTTAQDEEQITARVDTGKPFGPDLLARQRLAKVPVGVLGLFPGDSPIPILHTTKALTVLGRTYEQERAPTIDLTAHNAVELGVSRRHAAIAFVGVDYMIEDLGSLNGTFLNDVRLPIYVQRPLRSGDIIRLGRLNIAVYFHPITSGLVPVAETSRADGDGTPATVITRIPGTDEIVFTVDQKVVTKDFKPGLEFLSATLIPYLQALEQFQNLVNAMQGRVQGPMAVLYFQTIPHFSVGTTGVSEAVKLTRSVIGRWRREHAEVLATLISAAASGKTPELTQSQRAQIQISQAEAVADITALAGGMLSQQELSEFAKRLTAPLGVLCTSPICVEEQDVSPSGVRLVT